ncbi:transposase [Mesorhizobium sp. LSHC416B00]|nr:transposase [Mesorhizobium sp. LSHC416B00]
MMRVAVFCAAIVIAVTGVAVAKEKKVVVSDATDLCSTKHSTPFEYICKIWTKEPERFRLDPTHQTLGLNT